MTERLRAVRSDAQANIDALLSAASARLAVEGPRASLRAVATDAGVGIATLYRHFPTREHLVEAVYRSAVDQLSDRAGELLDEGGPADIALRRWSEEFLAFLAVKHGMTDALRGLLTDEDERLQTRRVLADALSALVVAGVKQRTVRDVDPMDLLLALGGVALIAPAGQRPDQARRLLDVLFHGLLTDPPVLR